MTFEIGIMTFGEITRDPTTGRIRTPHQRARETIELAAVADEVGLDVFGMGEHHRSDFVGSAPTVMLAAAAEATKQIRLASAVTVLSSDDPVRVWEQFATIDLLSAGRAEIIAGRGSYTESFPLFGYDLADYSELFREKLDLLLRIREENPLSWTGKLRPSLANADIAPRPYGETIPIWVGVGGSSASAVSTGSLGLPLALAILFGPMNMLQDSAQLYRAAAETAGHDPASLPISMSVGGYVGSSPKQARDTMYPHFAAFMMEHNHQRGHGMALPRNAFDAGASPAGSYIVGDAEEVTDKILRFREMYDLSRIIIQIGMGSMPHRDLLAGVERLGTEVIPAIRSELGDE
ncbi:MAG TPA: LLM class flavin-dependent oxidoreductase [Candidatus Agrococcus pullicola]|uniref:LLM class flavin-dependent oxidoreductase n=1 Tax=Candidatus Agrococcus pullicola TaxID=2838429 RepID=A0A9D1YSU7_9MICO|nr:LLM class flavin-dependent oxidoreductase [Candidatus Agrococcus pullicola]